MDNLRSVLLLKCTDKSLLTFSSDSPARLRSHFKSNTSLAGWRNCERPFKIGKPSLKRKLLVATRRPCQAQGPPQGFSKERTLSLKRVACFAGDVLNLPNNYFKGHPFKAKGNL